ncbi:MAG: aldo/keto reductase [Deltaproteobacteria bacterium]|jgi:predicted aldo/keto reductase-like oxidoreductase|nr:aldo/keto reductase [Deltaproteobacteria bacterium]
MDYRLIPKTGQKVSTVGVGGTSLHSIDEDLGLRIVSRALESGVNMIDLTVESPNVFPVVRKALKGQRERALLGLHLGLTFLKDGQYKRTRDVSIVRRGFEKQLAELGTDYADFAYIHYVDELADVETIFSSGTFDLALKLKKEGRIRQLGFSSHKTEICRRLLATKEIDIFMFSVNPAYDLNPVANNPMNEDWSDQNNLRVIKDRSELYRQAESEGVPITVMKPFAAGRLLDERSSPFKRAMTVPQLVQYCLDRPAVVTCLAGLAAESDLNELLAYYDSTPAQRDYSIISRLTLEDLRGQCVYCNHCLPCPARIDIASVHKFLDLALAGDQMAKNHYLALKNQAGACQECGSCEDNCPFQVPVREKMKGALKLFGR